MVVDVSEEVYSSKDHQFNGPPSQTAIEAHTDRLLSGTTEVQSHGNIWLCGFTVLALNATYLTEMASRHSRSRALSARLTVRTSAWPTQELDPFFGRCGI